MVAELCSFGISTARVEDVQKVGEQPAVMQQMVEQWLEVPKILPQDRILQTAKQIADHLDKRAVAGWKKKQREGCWNDRCAVERITAENDEKQLKLMVDECAAKVVNELQKKKVKTGENQKAMVEECAAKVVDELQKTMAFDMGKIQSLENQVEWTVQEGGQLMASLGMGDQDSGVGMGFKTTGDIEGSPRSSRARQVWLKLDGKVKAVELRYESAREMEEKVRKWMRVEEGMGLYVVSEGRRLSWRELAGLSDGKMAEIMIELKGGTSKKKNRKNPWTTPSQSSGSEPEIIRTATGGSSNEERDDEKLKEVLEKKVADALKEGGVLDQLVDGLAVMSEEEKEK